MENPIDIYFAMKEGKIALAQEVDISPVEILNEYLAILRVSQLVHFHSHWKCSGDEFYGNHLLFQRLYESSEERFDEIAEKIIGLYGNEALDIAKQFQLIGVIAPDFVSASVFENSINIEMKFLNCAEKVFKYLEDKEKLSLGLNDMIATHASKAEENLYLLKQAAKKIKVC